MVLNVYKKHNQNVDETIVELSGAVQVAEKQGRKRAMPKDTEGGEGSGGSSGGKQSLKAYLKELIK